MGSPPESPRSSAAADARRQQDAPSDNSSAPSGFLADSRTPPVAQLPHMREGKAPLQISLKPALRLCWARQPVSKVECSDDVDGRTLPNILNSGGPKQTIGHCRLAGRRPCSGRHDVMEQWNGAGATQEREQAASRRPPQEPPDMGRSLRCNWDAFWSATQKDHCHAGLIWNERTRSELREALQVRTLSTVHTALEHAHRLCDHQKYLQLACSHFTQVSSCLALSQCQVSEQLCL